MGEVSQILRRLGGSHESAEFLLECDRLLAHVVVHRPEPAHRRAGQGSEALSAPTSVPRSRSVDPDHVGMGLHRAEFKPFFTFLASIGRVRQVEHLPAAIVFLLEIRGGGTFHEAFQGHARLGHVRLERGRLVCRDEHTARFSFVRIHATGLCVSLAIFVSISTPFHMVVLY